MIFICFLVVLLLVGVVSAQDFPDRDYRVCRDQIANNQTCGYLEGDCNADWHCDSNLICEQDVGREHGYAYIYQDDTGTNYVSGAWVDVCVCPKFYRWDGQECVLQSKLDEKAFLIRSSVAGSSASFSKFNYEFKGGGSKWIDLGTFQGGSKTFPTNVPAGSGLAFYLLEVMSNLADVSSAYDNQGFFVVGDIKGAESGKTRIKEGGYFLLVKGETE